MLRVIRNHRRAAYGETPTATRSWRSPPVPLDHACAARDDARWSRTPRAAWDDALALGEAARLPQRAGHRDRADRHHRPGHGLRHHRHRARLRAGQVQEAGRRRLLQDHQPRGAGGAARARLHARAQIAEIEAYAVGHGTLGAGARRSTTTTLRAKGFTDEAIAKVEKALPTAFDINFVFNQWTLGEEFCRDALRHRRREARRRRPSTCWPRSASPSARSRPPTSTSAAR